MREPIANKTHYANGSTLLDKQFDEIFHHEKGPGALPASRLEHGEALKGVIVPHGSYPIAGPCMAWVYRALAELPEKVDFFFIVAQAQHSTEEGATMQTHVTPYGEVRVDQAFLRELAAKGNVKINDGAHEKESVIEIQLPFLQYIRKSQMESVKIVPLLLGPNSLVDELAVDIKETLMETKKTAAFIFVSNLTSYGREFHYVPFTDQIQDNIVEQDKVLLNAIAAGDREAFFSFAKERVIPLSGYGPFRLFFKLFGDRPTQAEQYYLSGDINDNYLNTVSYASILIK